MILIRIDAFRRRRQPARRRMDAQPIRPRIHRGAQLFQLGGHRSNTIGFLDTPTGDIPQRRHPFGEERRCRQRHRRIRNRIGVEVDAVQTPIYRRTRGNGAVADINTRAHPGQRLGKTHIALNRVGTDAFDTHRPAPQRTQRQEIRSRRRIAFDVHPPRRAIGTARRHDEAPPAFTNDLNAKARHHGQRHFDIRPGNQLAGHLDGRFHAAQR